MDYKEFIIAETERATESLFKIARAVPEEWLDWNVKDKARSVIEILRECAQSPLVATAFERQFFGDH